MDTHSRNDITARPYNSHDGSIEKEWRQAARRKGFSRHFTQNLFLSVGSVFLIFVLSFCIYQYRREKEFKTDIMHSRLQMYIYEMRQTLGQKMTDDKAFRAYITSHNIQGLRVTVTDRHGNVIIDSSEKDVSRMANHSTRHEIREALRHGNGYDIKRLSASTHETYFYSAALTGPYVVRVAVPYSAELTRSLQIDHSYIWYALAVSIILVIILYRYTQRIGSHIGYLREFAVMAENGEALDHELERRLPDDELGDISHTIITLYWKLRHSEEEKIRIKRQLTQNAAHELKTPAASIHGYLESILSHPDMPQEKRQHFLERCYAQSERMTKLLLDMAALTKLDNIDTTSTAPAADNVMAMQDVNVCNIIHSALDDTALQLSEKGIRVRTTLPDEIMMTADPSLLYSIFRNLIDNAIAYATGADTLTIRAWKDLAGADTQTTRGAWKDLAGASDNSTAQHGESMAYRGTEQNEEGTMYNFLVSDNGQGVEPQHLKHIFERFYRVDKGRSRKLGGTGLGLAIVKNAVTVYGGTCRAETTPGGGLTIRFSLRTKA